MSSDVTAVVLTLGEETTLAALASVERQTLRPAETVVVEGVSPFSAALTVGVRRVHTPYFVQVDADMILDETCFERLRAAVTPEVGIACGALRDPLLGTIGAVKLFRRACFDLAAVPDTVATDVDFYLSLGERGWLTLFALGGDEERHTLGDHRPDWTPEYTYATYHLIGCRYRIHSDLRGVVWRLGALRKSVHPMASIARYALCTGLFYQETRDAPKSSVPFDRPLLDALRKPEQALPRAWPGASVDTWVELGRKLGETRAYSQLSGSLRGLASSPIGETWPAEVCLCYGFSRGAGAQR